MPRVGATLLYLAVAACSPMRGLDRDGAYFSSLFGEQSVTCRALRKELRAEVDVIKRAQKQADDAFIAEQSAPAPPTEVRPAPKKGSETAALREVAKRIKQAEQKDEVLAQRQCRTVGVEQALK